MTVKIYGIGFLRFRISEKLLTVVAGAGHRGGRDFKAVAAVVALATIVSSDSDDRVFKR